MNKKKHPIILYVLIGLLVVAAAIGPIYSSIAGPDFGSGYNDYPKFMDFSNLNEIGDGETELIYRFHPQCGVCVDIKGEVLDFAESNEQGVTVYMTHVDYEENVPNGIERATPTLLVVVNGVIVDEYVGSNEIPQFLDDVNDGTYEVQ